MSRLTITMRDPLAERLAVAANVTGLHPEDLALCAVSSLVGHIEREGGLAVLPVSSGQKPTSAPTEPPTGSDLEKVAS